MSGIESTDSPVFWAALVLTAAACAAVLGRALLRPQRLVEFPVFAGAMWLYFYVVMAVGTALTLASRLPDWSLDLGQVTALVCFAALIVGWRWGASGAADPRAPGGARPSARVLWVAGVALMLAGGLSFRLFLGDGDPDWQGTSAYWYLLFHVTYPGLALALAASAASGGGPGIRASRLAAAAVALYALYPHLASARRGPLFPAVVVLVLVPPLVGRVTPSRSRVIGGLAAASFAMLLFVAVRPWLYEDGKAFQGDRSAARWRQALEEVTLQDVLVKRTVREGDNEYLYHCAMIATVVERGACQYGTGYLSLATHWIPRQWWPGKPELGEGMFPDAVAQVPLVVGWSMSAGASAGGVAEVFNQLSFASPLFWLAFGWAVGRVYARARRGELGWQLVYVGIVSASHWLVSQGVAAAFVPACVYVVVPLIVLRIARARPSALRAGTLRRPSPA